MIGEINIPNWDNKPVPIKDKVIYRQCKDINAPNNFYVSNKIDNRIILISPTSFSPSNNCFECLNGLDWEKDVMDDYDETHKVLKVR
jgi:hypothetical protein